MSDDPHSPQRAAGDANIGRPVDLGQIEGDFPQSPRSGTPEVRRTRRWVLVVVVVVAAVALIGGLLMLRSEPGSAVPWENYPSGLQQQIDDAAAAGDCEALVGVREDAVASESAQIEETGIGSEALIRYLDDQLAAADCPA
jgi:hypothetical protein